MLPNCACLPDLEAIGPEWVHENAGFRRIAAELLRLSNRGAGKALRRGGNLPAGLELTNVLEGPKASRAQFKNQLHNRIFSSQLTYESGDATKIKVKGCKRCMCAATFDLATFGWGREACGI